MSCFKEKYTLSEVKNLEKPPRAHHCRRCARCCLKMDHHCIWLSKCVGYSNQASFLVFLFGAVFGAFHATVMIINFRKVLN